MNGVVWKAKQIDKQGLIVTDEQENIAGNRKKQAPGGNKMRLAG